MVQGHDYVKMSTSVIDYIFRDLAINYLKRTDLGQVKPDDLLTTATKGEMDSADTKQRFGSKQNTVARPPQPMPAAGNASLSGGQKSPSAAQGGLSGPASAGPGGQQPAGQLPGDGAKGSVKLPAAAPAPGEVAGEYGPLPETAVKGVAAAQSQVQVLEQSRSEESEVVKIAQARIKGFEGDPCSNCGCFTLVRSGTCMRCNTCGSTTECS
jgi:ribonucleoside-diphosphate reductase alpha chain